HVSQGAASNRIEICQAPRASGTTGLHCQTDQAQNVTMRTKQYSVLALLFAVAMACSNHDATTAPSGPSFTINPCSVSGTLQLNVAQTARVDCSNGGTTVTLAGNGASYLVVAQFAVDLVPNALVPYHVSTGTAITASQTRLANGPSASRSHSVAS